MHRPKIAGSGRVHHERGSDYAISSAVAFRIRASRRWVELTLLLVVSDLERTRRFYRDVLGATETRAYGGTSAVLRFAGTWLLLFIGGGPTVDEPTVTFAPPASTDIVSHELTIRVTDCRAAYETLTRRRATFLTPPSNMTGRSAASPRPRWEPARDHQSVESTPNPGMMSSLRQLREATVLEHMEAENAHDFARCIAAFSHPRYEIVPTAEVWDGHSGVNTLLNENKKGFPDFRFQPEAMHHADTQLSSRDASAEPTMGTGVVFLRRPQSRLSSDHRLSIRRRTHGLREDVLRHRDPSEATGRRTRSQFPSRKDRDCSESPSRDRQSADRLAVPQIGLAWSRSAPRSKALRPASGSYSARQPTPPTGSSSERS